jgi:hypothetical protein
VTGWSRLHCGRSRRAGLRATATVPQAERSSPKAAFERGAHEGLAKRHGLTRRWRPTRATDPHPRNNRLGCTPAAKLRGRCCGTLRPMADGPRGSTPNPLGRRCQRRGKLFSAAARARAALSVSGVATSAPCQPSGSSCRSFGLAGSRGWGRSHHGRPVRGCSAAHLSHPRGREAPRLKLALVPSRMRHTPALEAA